MLKHLIRRIKLENMITDYIYMWNGPFWSPKARRQARQLLKDDRYNPL